MARNVFPLNPDLDNCHQRSRAALLAAWDACESPILLVTDEETGANTAFAEVRHLHNNIWIYVDEETGWGLMTREDVERLSLRIKQED